MSSALLPCPTAAPDRPSRFLWAKLAAQEAAYDRLAARYHLELLAARADAVRASAAQARQSYLDAGTLAGMQQAADRMRRLLVDAHAAAGHVGCLPAERRRT